MTETPAFGVTPQPAQDAQRHHKESALYTELSQHATTIASRVRMLEERVSLLRKKAQLTEQNLVEAEQSLSNHTTEFIEELRAMKATVQDLVDQAAEMRSELSKAAKERDVRSIERYIDYRRMIDEARHNI